MWLQIKETQEWIPFDSEHTSKVFLDGKKGWAIKQKDGSVYHVTKEQYEQKMLRELDSDAWWKARQIQDATRDLDADELAAVRKMLEKKGKKKKDDEEDD